MFRFLLHGRLCLYPFKHISMFVDRPDHMITESQHARGAFQVGMQQHPETQIMR